MNVVMCDIAQALVWLLRLYTLILLVYAVVSWIPDLRGRWVYYLAAVVEPVLTPIRRIIPPAGGIDWSFLVLLLVLQLLIGPLLYRMANDACYLIY